MDKKDTLDLSQIDTKENLLASLSESKSLSSFILCRAFLRTFFIQSSWNYESMQNLGFSYSIGPVLKKLYLDDKERISAFKRHISYFNTNPYLAPSILGVSIKLEEEIKRKNGNPEEINLIKASLMGSFGAIGDSFFWASVKPLSAVLSTIFGWLNFLWAPIVFIFFFNSLHMFIRIFGYLNGYYVGVDIIKKFKAFRFPDQTVKIKYFSAFCLGILLAIIVTFSGVNFGIKNNIISIFIFPSVILILSFLIKTGITQGKLLYLLLFSLILIYYAQEAG